MPSNSRTIRADLSDLEIIHYPDPRLSVVCSPIEQIDDSVRRLAERMLEIMFQANGAGLAASQLGITMQLFVASPTFQPDDRQVFVNPRIVSRLGSQQVEEGCLSVPGITCKIKRSQSVTVEATDLDGKSFTAAAEDLAARVYQHEIDHLNGRLLLDRMGSVARLANRRAIKELQEQFDELHE